MFEIHRSSSVSVVICSKGAERTENASLRVEKINLVLVIRAIARQLVEGHFDFLALFAFDAPATVRIRHLPLQATVLRSDKLLPNRFLTNFQILNKKKNGEGGFNLI